MDLSVGSNIALTITLNLLWIISRGSGEGFGLAAGIVYYAAEKGHNLPLYLAYQWDNDSRENDLILFQIGYFFRAWKQKP
jgi:hypothetical protein